MNIENLSYMTENAISYELGEQFPIHDLMSEVADPANVYASFDYVVDHLECAQQRDHIRPLRDKYCQKLIKLLESGEFRITPDDFRQIVVNDGPKERVCQCPKVFHRVGCHSVMVPFERHTYPTLIRNTGASIKGRGMHWLHQIIEEDIQTDPEGMKYYYQSDILHFYDNVSQAILKEQVREYVDDPKALPILDNFICLLPEEDGISKGLRSSQSLANLHLSPIDHLMCSKVAYHEVEIDGEKATVISGEGRVVIDGKEIRFHYYRYCDDIVMCAGSKNELWKLRDYLVGLLDQLGLQIKPNEAVRPMSSGLDYLGFVTYYVENKTDEESEHNNYSRIRKRTKQKFCRRLTRVKSRKRRQSLIGSFFGMAAHADCRHLLKKMITPKEYRKLKHKRRMKDFGELEVGPILLDGKKNLRGVKITPRELNNQAFIVVDFERIEPKRERLEYDRRVEEARIRGIDPSTVPPAKQKYLVQIIHNDMLRKFWTGDKELWAYLDHYEDADELPFAVAIEMDFTAQYPKANFVSAKKYGFQMPTDEQLEVMEKKFNVTLLHRN